jgi:hypothetical protein
MGTSSKRLGPKDLIQLLKNTIFGVEFQEEAAHIACFSLALAVCDALRPDIIWNELRFEKLIDNNIFIGDFALRGKDALIASGSAGFDIILGNPPFKSELTDPMKLNITKKEWRALPDKQMAYYVLKASVEEYLANSGRMCMIQHYGFLYNSNTAKMRSEFFNDYKVQKILDFISVDNLFYKADTKAMAVQIQKLNPDRRHIISHLTFRRTIAVQERIYFELDYYDYHYVSQEDAIDEKFKWKTNLLGGGRLNKLVKRFSDMDTFKNFIDSKGLRAREGYIIGKKKEGTKHRARKPKLAMWLYGKPLLVSAALKETSIDNNSLKTVWSKEFIFSGNENIYQSPLMIIAEMESLNCALWKGGFLAYTHEFIGINSISKSNQSHKELCDFFEYFCRNKSILKAFLQLYSGRLLTSRATATQKHDVMNLPWPQNGDFELVAWEKELLDDVRDYMAEYVRLGQNSKLLMNLATKTDLKNYSNTFLRVIRNAYPGMKLMKELESDNLILIAFSFSDKEDSLPMLDDTRWYDKLQSLMEKEQSYSLRTQRIVRILTGNTVIIIKPNKLRYWIRATAVRDVDDILIEILRGGAKDVSTV